MQDFSIFDLIIISITLILGLKGLFRGLIKEVFGIVGIIGAIFVASRISKDAGDAIAPILAIQSEATIKLVGFIVALVGFWLIVYTLGVIISKIFSASGLGAVDRIFGFVFGASKIFLIFSVIAYSLYQVQSFKKVMDEKFATSFVMPHLISVGSYIIKLDTDTLVNSFDKAVKTVKDTQIVKDATTNLKENVDSTLNNVQETVEEGVKDAVQEEIKSTKDKLKDIANKPEENR